MFLRFIIFLSIMLSLLWAQTAPVYGIRDKAPQSIAITNAHIVKAPGEVIEQATMLVENGIIMSIGTNVVIPPHAFIIDAKGAFVYPGFIDPISNYGLPKKGATTSSDDATQDKNGNNSGKHSNDAVHAEKVSSTFFSVDAKSASEYKKIGFTTLQTAFLDGIFRGQSAVVLLGEESSSDMVLQQKHAQFVSFFKGSSTSSYPGSLMGSIALIRQVFYDTIWYQNAYKSFLLNPHQVHPEMNNSLEALIPVIEKQQSLIFSVEDELSLLRAAKIAEEFSLQFIYHGSGREYQRLQAIKNVASTIIIPLNFPKVPDVSSIENQMNVSLAKLKHWNAAPDNPMLLEKENISFAFTCEGTEKGDFLANLRLAVQRGLSKEAALKALTVTPAEICGVSSYTGTLAKGKIANFIICNGDIFESATQINSVWVRGQENTMYQPSEFDFRGTWEVKIGENTSSLIVKGKIDTPSAEWKEGETNIDVSSFTTQANKVTITLQKTDAVWRFSGRMIDKKMSGILFTENDTQLEWQALKTADHEDKKEEAKKEDITQTLFDVSYPNVAFGRKTSPEQPQVIFIDNATIWTSGKDGVIKNGDMIVREGKIEKIGTDLTVPTGATVIDGSGQHVTPGIIDEHSHIAISRGVNEGTEAVTSEVRIGDVVDSDDIDIYRQLAGGVTSSHLLHGSANPIGGQLQLIKLRWGALPEEMKFTNLPKTIKFALGENVKQSNWGDRYTTRYPQTRMGVREIFYDVFQTAKEYEKEHADYNSLSPEQKRVTIPPRKDLELDAIVEILNKEMFIHCHSYVQSEILALARLANDFGFHVGTFTHVLEGYKVARELKECGAMASCFSDWWAYKFEVYDAIPHNAAVMHNEGVVVSINSDDAEMARRLNQEAAKSIKYGGLSEEDALKLVTINPAKQLYVDDRVGSLETGKEADFVIWNENPLSCYARVMQTWVDGRKYFDIEEDRELRKEVKTQRSALIQLALKKKNSGAKTEDATVKEKHHYHCDDIFDAVRGENND